MDNRVSHWGKGSKKRGRVLLAIFAIAIGLYPIVYFLQPAAIPFWSSKADLHGQVWWQVAFFAHITGGGLALLVGWTQFWPQWRARYLSLHRSLGKVYVASILLFGATGGFAVALVAIGGFPSMLGFGTLAVLWFFSTLQAWRCIRKKAVERHQQWMILSYALTFAAVTLRLWLPLFTVGLGLPFEVAYIAVAWWCWVPNLLVGAYLATTVGNGWNIKPR